MHDTVARAYGMPTQADFARAVALRQAAADAEKERRTANTPLTGTSPGSAPSAAEPAES
jgi:1-acyl-sn-glycerol-3-phosphate acyltransferase